MKRIACLLLVLAAPGIGNPVVGNAADIPTDPFVEVSYPSVGPFSLFNAPDGSGNPLTQAFGPTGQYVDATMTIVLYDDTPPWGSPVPNFPAEDIFLVDLLGELVDCQNGTIPDTSTDENGRTTFSGPFGAGGRVSPGDNNRLAFFVNGWILESDGLEQLHFNSSDLDGNLRVNLTDVWMFIQAYFGPYDYATDFHWDGAVNLSDLALLASTLGAECP